MYEVFNISKDYVTKKRIGLFKHKKEVKKAIQDVNLSVPRGKNIDAPAENGA